MADNYDDAAAYEYYLDPANCRIGEEALYSKASRRRANKESAFHTAEARDAELAFTRAWKASDAAEHQSAMLKGLDYPEGHASAAMAHLDAANAYDRAAKEYRRIGNEDKADACDGMQERHSYSQDFHENRAKGADLTASRKNAAGTSVPYGLFSHEKKNSALQESAFQKAANPSANWADQFNNKPKTPDDLSDIAEQETGSARRFGPLDEDGYYLATHGQYHARAAQAHDEAAEAHRAAGNQNKYEYHASLAGLHQDLANSLFKADDNRRHPDDPIKGYTKNLAVLNKVAKYSPKELWDFLTGEHGKASPETDPDSPEGEVHKGDGEDSQAELEYLKNVLDSNQAREYLSAKRVIEASLNRRVR